MSVWNPPYGGYGGRSPGRHGPRRILGAFGSFFLLIVVINVVVSLLTAVAHRLCVGPQCGPPVVSKPVADDTVWRSTRYGYSLEYPSAELSVAHQNPSGVELANGPLVLLFSAVPGGPSDVPAAIAAQVSALRSNVFDLARATQPADQLLGPNVGFVAGRGGAYAGNTSSAQGVTNPIYLAVQAASHGGLVIIATAVVAKNLGATDRMAADQLADLVDNSVVWPAGPVSTARGTSPPVRSDVLAQAIPGAKLLGPPAGGRMIAFSLSLAHRGGLERFVAEVNDPRSPLYGQFLSARSLGERYGIARRRLRALERVLESRGITVTAQYPQRTALDVRAPVATVDRVFGVRLEDFRDPGGSTYYAPSAPARIPSALADVVTGVGGLDTEPLTRPPSLVRPAAPAGGLTPRDAASAYDIAALRRLGIDGQGQRLAIVGDGDRFDPADLIAFDRRYGLPQTLPAVVLVDGGGQLSSSAGVRLQQLSEADLDTEVAHSLAPDAKILYVSQAYNDGSLIAPAINRIVARHAANIVSVSYGLCEPDENSGNVANDDNALLAAAAAGISVFVASGDQGAYACQAVTGSDRRLAVSYPGSSPYVVSVGGTSLAVGSAGRYLGENVWEDVISQAGSGGGLSRLFGRPSWQAGPGVQNAYSDGMRQVPDVAADADPSTGFATVVDGQPLEAGGTSAAAPFWAAAMALIAQYASVHGHRSLGFAAPVLYQLAASAPPHPPFHPILTGANRFYPATPGWSFATGLGSPDVFNLARDVVAYLRRTS
jgi:Pro-kumamolisin, activation domain/Subtilase family